MKSAITVFLFGLVLASPGRAADAICSGIGLQPDSAPVPLAPVVGPAARVNFIASGDDKKKACPSANSICQRNAFVTPGDAVLVDRVEGAYACATYKSPRGTLTEGGWLPAAALDLAPKPANVKAGDWAGNWVRDKEASVTLKVAGADVSVDGNATYGALDPGRVRRGAVNIGELSGKARPRGAVLALGEGYDGAKAPGEVGGSVDCLARLRLFGRYLVVEDNHQCGGNNVSFTGVFVRAAK